MQWKQWHEHRRQQLPNPAMLQGDVRLQARRKLRRSVPEHLAAAAVLVRARLQATERAHSPLLTWLQLALADVQQQKQSLQWGRSPQSTLPAGALQQLPEAPPAAVGSPPRLLLHS